MEGMSPSSWLSSLSLLLLHRCSSFRYVCTTGLSARHPTSNCVCKWPSGLFEFRHDDTHDEQTDDPVTKKNWFFRGLDHPTGQSNKGKRRDGRGQTSE